MRNAAAPVLRPAARGSFSRASLRQADRRKQPSTERSVDQIANADANLMRIQDFRRDVAGRVGDAPKPAEIDVAVADIKQSLRRYGVGDTRHQRPGELIAHVAVALIHIEKEAVR